MNNLISQSIRKRRPVTVFITVLLAVVLCTSTAWAAPSTKELKNEQDKKQSEVDALNEEKASVDADLASYIEQISKVSSDQKKCEEELTKAQAEADAQYASMKERIRFMYEEGSVSMMNVLLRSQDMGDFLNHAYYVSTISEYDRKMLVEYQKITEKVKKKKAELASQKKKLEKLQQERLKNQEELAAKIKDATDELAAAKAAYAKASEAEKAAAKKRLEQAQANAKKVSQTEAPEPRAPKSKPSSSSGSGSNGSWNGRRLTRSAGTIMGPSGKETYYNLDMSGVVKIMRRMGNKDKYWVRGDGCKMLGNYIMVAANLQVRPRGSHIMTSLGMGIVCDTGGFARNNIYQLDIATNW